MVTVKEYEAVQRACSIAFSITISVIPLLYYVYTLESFFMMVERNQGKNTRRHLSSASWGREATRAVDVVQTIGRILSCCFIPVVILQHSILDHDMFVITSQHRLSGVAADAAQSALQTMHNDTDTNLTVAFNHPVICRAIESEYDCFQHAGISISFGSFKSKEIKKKCDTPGLPYEYPCQIFERDAAVSCNSDGLVMVTKRSGAENGTIDDLEHGLGVSCYRWKEQTPMAYLDSVGIATGVVAFLTYLLNKASTLFSPGELKMAQNPSKIQPKCAYVLWISAVILYIATEVECRRYIKENLATYASFSIDYTIPCIALVLWMFGCGHILEVSRDYSSELRVVTKLFERYSSTGTIHGKWTSKSTAQLGAQVQQSRAIPSPDTMTALTANELRDSMAVTWFDAIDFNGDGMISKDELAKRLRTDTHLVRILAGAGIETDVFVFEQIDSNKDGKISLDELTTLLFPMKDTTDWDALATVDEMNTGILRFLYAIKKKAGSSSLTFEEVWGATWTEIGDARSTNAKGQHWWELDNEIVVADTDFIGFPAD